MYASPEQIALTLIREFATRSEAIRYAERIASSGGPLSNDYTRAMQILKKEGTTMDNIYLALLKKYFNIRRWMIIPAVRKVNRITRRMMQNGYTPASIYPLVDSARAYNGLPAIDRTPRKDSR